ncbi:MAG: putative septum site-determining protein MinC [Candidatus Poribacteria bacterium]|nr:MAG: putative septum site-determining protein MinC [Candidatus Poribacteria bacterium]
MRQKEPILVRGYRNGLYVTVDDSVPTEELADRIVSRLARLGSFVKGAPLVLEVGQRSLNDEELRQIQKQLDRQYGLRIVQLVSGSDATRSAAEILRIRAVPTLFDHRVEEPPALRAREPNTITIRHTLRAGASEQFLQGSILVLGDVNPGAELVASGDIIVLGTLRGVVHAGALGDEGAVVIALRLLATQIRIAGHIARSPEGEREARPYPEIALVEKEQIVVRRFEGF